MQATTTAPVCTWPRTRLSKAQGSRRCSKESPNTQQSDGKSERNISPLIDSTSAQTTEPQDAFARSANSGSISMAVYSHPGFSAVYARAKAPLLQPTSTTLLRFFGINRRTSGLWRPGAGVCFMKDSISGISRCLLHSFLSDIGRFGEEGRNRDSFYFGPVRNH